MQNKPILFIVTKDKDSSSPTQKKVILENKGYEDHVYIRRGIFRKNKKFFGKGLYKKAIWNQV